MPQIQFFGSQVGGGTVINYSYTDMPWKLVFWDFWNFLKYARSLIWVVMPLWPCYGGSFDELSLTFQHVWCLSVHTVLIILQVIFLLGLLPLLFILPGWLFVSGLVTFFAVNALICRTLNGSTIQYTSDPKYSPHWERFEHEQWIFLNGVSIGESWLKDNLNRLALTFGRPVLGIHNRTSGIIFDLIECIIQRSFGYATTDVRLVYKILKDKLYNPQYTTVVFIIHSQGGIEGGLVIDWLLQEVPQDLLAKLEVYTFGNAANHFNNPHRHQSSQEAQVKHPHILNDMFQRFPHFTGDIEKTGIKTGFENPLSHPALSNDQGSSELESHGAALDRAIGHIEHYAHTGDFVALWGVLHFITNTRASAEIPRFVGRLFAHHATGHLLSQHYLNDMFPLAKNAFGEFTGCAESNEFMDSIISLPGQGEGDNIIQAIREGLGHSFAALDHIALPKSDVSVQGRLIEREISILNGPVRVRDLSRLWQYRNGQTPRIIRKV
ncbi:uncharacterized protein F4812DRAFT_467905 [Daldinia caldariorum]|uniref:uncharacterized protein n=1 Tax=Daldinia caldariorum TaxID=326644 RepID=UPI0020086E20|nr:uncharacterized protein F4812DRAFT_467905 [Daldinia caldariorum]KAI1472077.1 hypothetical protein F4812DRAFT_467905 [Daldinia caldariorum]